MIRYLMVFRVNAPMVWFHLFPPLEFSLALGTIIAESLPSSQARPWEEALEPWKPLGGLSLLKNKPLKHPPRATWPVESVLFCYPGKRAYGEGEWILMELKLMGESADHAFFLEVILPAIEKASRTIDLDRQRPDSLWGRFDIQHIYVARGHNWEPLVNDCRLNLKYTATPHQWAEGLELDPGPARQYHNLTWVTPFDLRTGDNETSPFQSKNRRSCPVPSLGDILLSFQDRMNSLDTGGMGSQALDILEGGAGTSLQQLIEACSGVPVVRERFYATIESQPGRWIGRQSFAHIPDAALPYLALATIFHIGANTHFGCGTFMVD